MYNIVEQNLKTYLKMSKIWTCSGNTYTRITSGYGVENQSVIAYFNSNEEMESWARAFIDFSKKPFVYLK